MFCLFDYDRLVQLSILTQVRYFISGWFHRNKKHIIIHHRFTSLLQSQGCDIMAMASTPKVTAPMDFGIEYLNSPSHGNLKFLFHEGEELLANSAIMSFNSPVIKKMTVEDGRTTVDVHDFSKEAVQCFLKASYSGSLEKLSTSIFRDLNKIAHDCEVDWIANKCFAWFITMVEMIEEKNFISQLFLFDEAMFILKKLKKGHYFEAFAEKLRSRAPLTEYFVTNYLSDISFCTERNLDAVLELVNTHEYILVKVLLSSLKIDNSSLHPNSRRILERLDFSNHPLAHYSLYSELLEMLEMVENPSKEDYRLIMKILRQQKTSIKSEKKSETSNLLALPNLFLEFKQLKNLNSLDEITTFLLESPQVTNCYIFYDAMFAWLMDKSIYWAPFVSITDNFVETFERHARRRNWPPPQYKYMLRTDHPCLGNLSEKLLEGKSLTSTGYHRVRSIVKYTPEELFSVDHDIKFKLSDPSTNNCNLPGHCGFILRVKAATGNNDDSFDIKLVTDQDVYDGLDIHFHKNSLQPKNMHFTLDITNEKRSGALINVPVSWCGKPQRDGTGKHWCWGRYSFYKKGEGKSPADNIHRVFTFSGSNSRIRPVVYYSITN